MALYKQCTKCATKYLQGKQCPNGCNSKRDAKKYYDRWYDKHKRANKEVYTDKRWKKLTADCKKLFYGLDVYAFYIKGEIIHGNLSHHILEVEECQERRYDLGNLLYVSSASHTEIHNTYTKSNKDKRDMQDLLFSLVKRWRQEYMI